MYVTRGPCDIPSGVMAEWGSGLLLPFLMPQATEHSPGEGGGRVICTPRGMGSRNKTFVTWA